MADVSLNYADMAKMVRAMSACHDALKWSKTRLLGGLSRVVESMQVDSANAMLARYNDGARVQIETLLYLTDKLTRDLSAAAETLRTVDTSGAQQFER